MIHHRSQEPAYFRTLPQDRFKVYTSDDLVLITPHDYADERPHFEAYTEKSDPSMVSFDIRTTTSNGERDPFFKIHRASILARHALEYFERTRDIRRIDFWWVNSSDETRSDNLTAYIKAKQEFAGHMPEPEARQWAALATWTAQRIAIPNGFTVVKEIDEVSGLNGEPAEVVGVFEKP